MDKSKEGFKDGIEIHTGPRKKHAL